MGPLPAGRLRLAAAGDPAAVTEFIEVYWPRLHRVAALITGTDGEGEDVAQDAIVRAVAALPGLDLARPIGPWIDRVGANAARDWIRKRSRRNEVPIGDEPVIGDGNVEWAAELRGSGLSEAIRDALLSLSESQRAVVVMRHLLDMPATEVASVLELPEGSVRSLDHRALKSLREQLQREEVRDA